MKLSDFDDYARSHHGLLTQAASGLSRDSWHRAIASGSLIKVHPKVARLPGAPITYQQRIAGAVLSASGAALASHRSSAYLLGLVADDEMSRHSRRLKPNRSEPTDWPTDIIIPGDRRHVSLVDIEVHRPRDQQRLTPQRPSGIASTNVMRTLLDLGAVAPDLVDNAVGRALSNRSVSLDALTTMLLDQGGRGRSGTRALRDALDTWALDHKPADSVLEIAFATLCRRSTLPAFEFHAVIAGWEVDFRFVGTPVVVECDGWATHGLDKNQFERDRRKDDDLRAAGWIPLRFSYRAVVNRPSDVARRIRRSLETWAHATAPDAA